MDQSKKDNKQWLQDLNASCEIEQTPNGVTFRVTDRAVFHNILDNYAGAEPLVIEQGGQSYTFDLGSQSSGSATSGNTRKAT